MHKIEERNSIVLENQGQKIFAMLHKPLVANKGHRKHPAVLMCHGFGGNKVGKYRIYVMLAERLAREGIASLRFDFRGSGDSEGDFREMTVESEISDTIVGLQYLAEHPDVDESRIGLLGNSFGAAISVMTASQHDKIKSLALLAALFSSHPWMKHWQQIKSTHTTEGAQEEMLRLSDGNVPGPLFLEGFFKLNLEPYLANLQQIPLLHVHSISDERINVQQADEYLRCRQGAIAETKSIRLEKSDHHFSNAQERQIVIDAAASWFAKTL